MNDTTKTQDRRSSSEIQKDIRGARDDMDQTLDQLNDRLSPRSLINSVMDWFEKGDSSSTQNLARRPKQLARFVRENPVPALLTGIGVVWLIVESQSEDKASDSNRNRANYGREEDRVAPRVGQDFDRPGDHGERGVALPPPPAAGSHNGDAESLTDKVKHKLGDASEAVSSAASATRDKIADLGDEVAERGSRATHAIKDQAARGLRSVGRASDQVQRGYAKAEDRLKEAVDDYPLGFGVGFVGLGLLAGLLLPRSKAEDEWFGDSADELKDTVIDKGEELLERGAKVAGRVADKAVDELEHQGLTSDNASSAIDSVGEKIGAVVAAAKEEGKKAAHDEHLTPDDLKSEAETEARRAKEKATEHVGR